MASSSIYTDDAIVLMQKDWSQADKIITLYTRGHGLVRAAAYGSRRSRSPLAGIQLFGEIKATLAEGGSDSHLDTIRQYTSLDRHRTITEDIERLAYGSLITEVAAHLSPDHVPDETVYDALAGILLSLAERNPQLVALSAIVQLLSLTGWGHILPEGDDNEGAVSPPPETVELLTILAGLDWKNPPAFTARRSQIAACEAFIIDTLAKRTGCRPRSLNFIRQMRGY
ncbi:MAG: DNA repair protein RecO [Selenomonadaceae bacterium]|nr:DNA repair protein RecO [Selenomonadaceae bacterium]